MPAIPDDTRAMIEAMKAERQRLQERLRCIDEALSAYGVIPKEARTRTKKPNNDDLMQGLKEVASVAVMPIEAIMAVSSYAGLKQTDAVYHYLSHKGGSAHIAEIARGLLAGGLYLHGTEHMTEDATLRRLRQSLVSALLRDRRFMRVGKNTFCLSENEVAANLIGEAAR